MAPSRRKTIATRSNNNPPARRIIMTRSIYKKQLQANSSEETLSANKSSDSAIYDAGNGGKENVCYDVVCSTPRGKKYKIQKISTCPPAPKKSKRLVLKTTTTTTMTKTKFFTHPDLELFFLFSPSCDIHA